MKKFRQSIFVSLLSLMSTTVIAQSSGGSNDTFTTIMSTKFDFGETRVNGESKAPDDFFLRGRQSQSLSQMVKLRSSFKQELRSSRSAVKSLTR